MAASFVKASSSLLIEVLSLSAAPSMSFWSCTCSLGIHLGSLVSCILVGTALSSSFVVLAASCICSHGCCGLMECGLLPRFLSCYDRGSVGGVSWSEFGWILWRIVATSVACNMPLLVDSCSVWRWSGVNASSWFLLWLGGGGFHDMCS